MTQFERIGIDTSKAVFTLHGIDQQKRPVLRINLRRAQMISFFKKLPPTVIANQDGCGGTQPLMSNSLSCSYRADCTSRPGGLTTISAGPPRGARCLVLSGLACRV
jgi:hypothetical protein